MNIVLGVSGGIAAYKAVSLARLFVEAGHELHVVPTANALEFVGAVTWEAISGHPVTHEVNERADEVRHVRLGQQADAVVVAPATASAIARLAAGIADDLLGTTALATRAPLILAPAMHTEMWEHPATRRNVELLRERGATIVGPDSGRLTGADSGPGRMSDPERIFAETLRVIGAADATGGAAAADAAGADAADAGAGSGSADRAAVLAGRRVAVSAG
ncbi:flavoprotein, partial [Leucobacter soli]